MIQPHFSPGYLIRRLGDVMSFYGFEIPELQSGLLIVLRGFWVVNPAVDNTHMYAVLSPLIPFLSPAAWSCIFVFGGLYQMWALLTDDLRHRRRATFAATMLWLFFALLSVVSIPQLNTIALFILFSAENAWSYIRLRALL